MNRIENTPENKERFIALYWGQIVLLDVNGKGEPVLYPVDRSNMYRLEESSLELTPLPQISDEDAIEVLNLTGLTNEISENWDFYQILLKQNNFMGYFTRVRPLFFREVINIYHFLISKGYYVGDGTEVEYGWCRLKESQDLK